MSPTGKTWRYRPAGALCVQCNYRPAMISAKFPDRCVLYCSDHCRNRAGHQRDRALSAIEADAIRALLGLEVGRGGLFTLPELEAIHRRIKRLLPAGAMPRYPARRRRTVADR